ncbi:unnamed protein product, partial [Natator depressus]
GGETAIIRQFLYNDFTDTYRPAGPWDIDRPSLIYNGNMYGMKIMDVPYFAAFPADSSPVGALCRPARRCRY